MAPTASHIISGDGLRKFRLYHFIRTWGKDSVFKIFRCCFLEGTTKPIRQILEDNKVSLGKRGPFNSLEVDFLTNEPPESLDLTALNKICQALWEKGVNDPGKKVKDLVKIIKDERNNVSHDERNLSQKTLELKLQSFGKKLEELLNEAVVLYPCHGTEFHQLKTEVNESIPKIQEKIREKYNHSDPDDMKKLQAEMEEFGDKFGEYIRGKSVKQLKHIYQDLCKILLFDWLNQFGVIEPCVLMVSLQVDIDSEFQSMHSSHASSKLEQSDILNQRDPSGKDPKVIIISGDAGSGKTTLLCWLLEKWHKQATDITCLSSYEVLLYMEFRKHDYSNFDDYLGQTLQHQVTEFGFNQVKTSILRSTCLVLCDGYDEKNPKSVKLFEEILRENWNIVKIIVTTRPVNTKELTRLVNKSKRQRINLTILGLQNSEMNILIKKLTNHLVQEKSKASLLTSEITHSFESMTLETKTILKNPLLFSMFILLHIQCPDARNSLTTQTSLYIEFNKHRSKKLVEKLELDDEEKVNEFEIFLKEWTIRFYADQKYELYEEDISVFREKCKDLCLHFDSVISAYFIVKYSLKGLELVKVYCYRHRTEQEFYVAATICDSISKLYNTDRHEFDQLIEKMQIISYVHPYIPYKAKSDVNSQVMMNSDTNILDNMPYEVESLHDVLRFVTGILHRTKKYLLYLTIDNILSYIAYSTLYDDVILYTIVETCSDSKVLDAVAKALIPEIEREDRFQLEVRIPENLSCVPTLLPKIQQLPILSIRMLNHPDEYPHLMIPALEAAVLNDIGLNLYIESRAFVPSSGSHVDKYLDKAKTCVSFSGTLSEKGFQYIPQFISILELSMDLKLLESLTCCLPNLKKLDKLSLVLHNDGTVNPDHLSTVPYAGTSFNVTLYTAFDVDQIDQTAELLNRFWPKFPNSPKYASLKLHKKTRSLYTGDAVESLLKSLEIQPLGSITFQGVEDEDIDHRLTDLNRLSCSRKLGVLGLGYDPKHLDYHWK